MAEDLASLAGLDQVGFNQLAAQHSRGLLAHCYRMLGSLQDAEDTLQETLLRAWRGLTGFEGRASLQSWLYRIATNASIDALNRRGTRTLPHIGTDPGDPRGPMPPPVTDPVWLDPFPDALLPQSVPGPDARHSQRESITLAFLVVLQRLPARQRAALLLRDVLGYSAEETAGLLEITVAAANSALQRARAGLAEGRGSLEAGSPYDEEDSATADLVERYVAAWEAGDPNRVVELLRDDASFTMPPLAFWLRGGEAIRDFLTGSLLAGDAAGRFRLLAVRANGAPGVAVYGAEADGSMTARAVQVLVPGGRHLAEVHSFLLTPGSDVLTRFGLAPSL
jgi:RNA polymerase sigma-70 factor (ECF subfamily)